MGVGTDPDMFQTPAQVLNQLSKGQVQWPALPRSSGTYPTELEFKPFMIGMGVTTKMLSADFHKHMHAAMHYPERYNPDKYIMCFGYLDRQLDLRCAAHLFKQNDLKCIKKVKLKSSNVIMRLGVMPAPSRSSIASPRKP